MQESFQLMAGPILAGLLLIVVAAMVAYTHHRITKANQMLERAEKIQRDYRQMIDSLQDGVCILVDGKVLQVNPTIVRWTGYSSHYYFSRPFEELFIESDRDEVARFIYEAMQPEPIFKDIQARLASNFNDKRWVQIQMIRTVWDGMPAFVIILRDFSAAQQAALSLKKSHSATRLWLELAPVGMLQYDQDLFVVDVNRSVSTLFQIDKDLALGYDLRALPNRRLVETLYKSVNGEEALCEICLRDLNFDSEKEMLIRCVPVVEDGQIRGGLALIEDATVLKQALQVRHSPEELLTKVFNLIPDGLTITRLEDGMIEAGNPGFCDMMGFAPDEVVGHSTLELNMWPAPADRELFLSLIRTKGELRNEEFTLCRKDGALFLAEISARRMANAAQGNPFLSVIRDVSQERATLGQLQTRIKELSALRAIDQAIIGSVDLPFVLRVILEQIIKQFDLDAAAVMVYNPDLDRCDYLTQYGFVSLLPKQYDLHRLEGYAAQAFYQRERILVDDLQKSPDWFWKNPPLMAEGMRFYAAQPLRSKGEILGVLEVFSRRGLKPGSDWFDFLDAIVDQAAVAADNSLAMTRLNKKVTQLSSALEVILESLSRSVDSALGRPKGWTRGISHLSQDLAVAMNLRGTALQDMAHGIMLQTLLDVNFDAAGDHSPDEWQKYKEIQDNLFDLMRGIGILVNALEIPLNWQEAWNGSGQPIGLCGEMIPLSARIYRVVRDWSVLQSPGDGRTPLSAAEADQAILAQAEKIYDPIIVQQFISTTSLSSKSAGNPGD